MKFIKFLLSLVLLLALLYVLNNRLVIKGTPVPPLGRFLDPHMGFWQNAEADSLSYTADLVITGLQEPVNIQYDAQGVPHIFASNDHDLYMAQGYIIAQHRLWQMEFQTHAAAGRVSEIIGPNGLNFDRLQRRKGMTYGAQKTFSKMKEDAQLFSNLEAYADGVNAYINSLSTAELPVEYKLLGYTPEPWTPYKSALILEYMIDNLTGHDNDLEHTNALKLLGKETYERLFPEWLPGNDPVVPTDDTHPWDFDTQIADSLKMFVPEKYTSHILDQPDPDNGSNNWAVSGSKTVSGKPILANDTHLNLNLPSLWIMLQLHAPGINVYGFTFTGALGITIGFNDSTAWGFTNAPRDHKDWYSIQFKNDKNGEYWYNNKWRPTSQIIEEIKIRGADTYYDTIIYTHHGPVVYDKNFGDEDPRINYALRWIGHDASEVQKALYLLNRADNYEDYRQAIQYWDAPPQNIVFASTKGNIALTVQGNFTAKWPGQGKFLMDGSIPVNDWGSLVPKEQNPYQYNPDRGFVSSANQHSVDTLYPYWVYNSSYEYHRNRIINRYLTEMDSITVEDMMKMQNDSYGLMAEEILPMMLDSLYLDNLSPAHQEVVTDLRQWDYHYLAKSVTPVYFQEWWRQFYHLLWDEFEQKDIPLKKPNYYTTTYMLRHAPDSAFIDIDSTTQSEGVRDLVTISFVKAMEVLNSEYKETSPTWGEYKNTYVRHLADLGGSLAGFSRYGIQVDGEADAINSTKRNHGPSERFIVEMTSPPQAWGVYPGGQSGNPGSPYYDNLIDLWRDGKYVPLLFMSAPDQQQDQIIYTQTLNPTK